MEREKLLIEKVEALGNEGRYKEQGELFLTETGTTLEVKEAEIQTEPIWADKNPHGIQYQVTLKNSRGSYTFSFWGSIADREMLDLAKSIKGHKDSPEYFKVKDYLAREMPKTKHAPLSAQTFPELVRKAIKPNAYDILACLDQVHDDNFEDWCANYGYDTDSRKAEETYHACIEQDRMLRRLFSPDELEAMESIR